MADDDVVDGRAFRLTDQMLSDAKARIAALEEAAREALDEIDYWESISDEMEPGWKRVQSKLRAALTEPTPKEEG